MQIKDFALHLLSPSLLQCLRKYKCSRKYKGIRDHTMDDSFSKFSHSYIHLHDSFKAYNIQKVIFRQKEWKVFDHVFDIS